MLVGNQPDRRAATGNGFFWPGRRVLVTGAAGFVGAHLVGRLLGHDAIVHALLRPGSRAPRLDALPAAPVRHAVDLTDPAGVAAAVAACDPEVVFHLAAAGVARPASPQALADANIGGTLALLEALRERPLHRFVQVGSCFEYGEGHAMDEAHPLRPTAPYGATKAAAHLLAHAYRRSWGLPVVSARLFTPYGPWEAPQRLIPHVILTAGRGEPVPLTGGEQERDFVYVEDVVDGLLATVTATPGDDAEALNLCSGRPVRIRALVECVLSLLGRPDTARFGALPYRQGEMWHQSGCPDRALATIGWSPATGLEDGLRRTVAWYRDHPHHVRALTEG